MSQSFSKFYSHIVFHTKNNVKFIREDIEDELYSYMGGILRNFSMRMGSKMKRSICDLAMHGSGVLKFGATSPNIEVALTHDVK